MKLRVGQLDLVVAILNWIDGQAKEQGIKGFPMPVSRKMKVITDAATAIQQALASDDQMAAPAMGLAAWLKSDDTGLSSRTMALHLCGAVMNDPVDERHHHPRDPDDFGRCHRFLEAVPEARPKLPQMASVSPVWAELVAHWDELTALYLRELASGIARELYARMKALGC